MNYRYNNKKSYLPYFLIIFIFLVNYSFADALTSMLIDNGWVQAKDCEINTQSGLVSANSYLKKIGSSEAQIVYVPSIKKFYGSEFIPDKFKKNLILFDNEIHTINWISTYGLTVGGINYPVENENTATAAIQNFEVIYSRDTKELYKIRRYKGAFGPYDVGGRALRNVRFSNSNLLLTFLDGGQESTLELGAGFEYVSSTIGNGKKIAPNAVVSTPMKVLADVQRKMAADGAKMVAAEQAARVTNLEDKIISENKTSVTSKTPIADNVSDIEITKNQQKIESTLGDGNHQIKKDEIPSYPFLGSSYTVLVFILIIASLLAIVIYASKLVFGVQRKK